MAFDVQCFGETHLALHYNKSTSHMMVVSGGVMMVYVQSLEAKIRPDVFHLRCEHLSVEIVSRGK